MTTPRNNDDDLFVFQADDDIPRKRGKPEKTWKVLLVDDEVDVHKATTIALEGVEFEGRKLSFVSAFSSSDAVRAFEENPDIALVFLDVVLGSGDSGIDLIRYIRKELDNRLVRIVLRTGQPGEAPEEEVILVYDINDYKEKSGLTSQKLYTTVIAALRAYTSLVKLESLNKDLTEEVVKRFEAETQLKMAHDELEIKVEERTRELSVSNAQLRDEIVTRRRMESELIKTAKLESIGILAGGIAHDFNNLLTGIIGNISLARTQIDLNDRAYGYLDDAQQASKRAKDLTHQLLTYSSGGAPIRKTVDTAKLLKDTVVFCSHGAIVTFDFEIDEDLSTIYADGGQVAQVFQNLIINAKQAMGEGGAISIRAKNIEVDDDMDLALAPGGYVMIEFEDRGIGISSEQLDKVFDPFFTTKDYGSGLGLATALSVINNHGGRLDIESTINVGTIGRIYLPVSTKPFVPNERALDGLVRGQGKILVMDDEIYILKVVLAMLRKLGYKVDSATDGEKAVAMYEQAMKAGEPYAAMLFDVVVPGGMGGEEAIKRILEIDPEAKAIVFSGYAQDPILANYRDYGFKGVIPKPFDLHELSKEIHKVVYEEA